MGAVPLSVAIADIDADGLGDLVVADRGSDQASVRINAGGGLGYADLVSLAAPRAYWRFGELAGTTARDAMGASPGRYLGGVRLGQPGAVPGDSAARFDGADDRVRVADTPALRVGDRFSVEAWFRRDRRSRRPEGLFLKGFQVYLDDGGRVVLRKPGVAAIARSSVAITDTTAFHHVVVTKDGGSVHVYVDGEDVTVPLRPRLAIVDTRTPLTIGAGATRTFAGTLDEVALYGYPLTPLQVAEHVRAGRT